MAGIVRQSGECLNRIDRSWQRIGVGRLIAGRRGILIAGGDRAGKRSETGKEQDDSRLTGLELTAGSGYQRSLQNAGCTEGRNQAGRWMGESWAPDDRLGSSWDFKSGQRVYKKEPEPAQECGTTDDHSDFGCEVGTFQDVW
jgi:hypothetical protein